MATQDTNGVTFSILPEEDHQSFRLLELPPELLSLLVSDNPPKIQLKSAEGTPGHATDSTAVICTPDKTWSLRQVNHSNSVYITRSALSNGDDFAPPGLEAFAQSGYTLELNPPQANVTATPFLKASVPLYVSVGTALVKEPKSKRQVFNDIPLNDADCEQAWKDLACFEADEGAGCARPSGQALVNAWSSILNQATASGVDLTAPVTSSQIDLLIDPNEDWPIELSQAVLYSVATKLEDGHQIEKTKCVSSVGQWLLEARTLGLGSLPRADFLSLWSNSLPESWRTEATLPAIKGTYILKDGNRNIALADDSNTPDAAAEAKLSLGAKRKWHEKFRASKKTA